MRFRALWNLLRIAVLAQLLFNPFILHAEQLTYAMGKVTPPSGIPIPVLIADTPSKRSLGLGIRDSLEPGHGMLFVFPQTKPQSFWMKDMNFSIDIIWIRNHRVVHVETNVSPPMAEEVPKILKPGIPANLVLEVNAGEAHEHGINPGASLVIEF